MKTIHFIFHAHLDPIWLWPWTAGIDEALATCRSACDRLDAHPDLRFTQGEAWVYQQIEHLDSALFDRICAHVNAGRWELAGGWWLQPDCNQPSGFAWEQHIAIGQDYFHSRFGRVPRIGFNPDSFGHAATLPGMMRAAGQPYYVMMRPQEHEHALPARLFRWRGYADGPEVTVFRIAGSYNMWAGDPAHLARATSELPPGVEHTMCFGGIGNHGGGPTESLIAWLKENRDCVPGWRVEFSTMERYFAAVAPQLTQLPQVTGELQMHAIGCYSVGRPIKVAVRQAEHLLAQAEVAAALDPLPPAGQATRLHEAWEWLCFHHFHDTLGGTCIPSAYPQALNQLGHVNAVADATLQYALRRQLANAAPDPRQRLVLFNASDAPYSGYIECEPWLGWKTWDASWRLLDGAGQPVPLQVLAREAILNPEGCRLLFHAALAAGERGTWYLDQQGGGQPIASGLTIGGPGACNDAGVAVDFSSGTLYDAAENAFPLPRLHLLPDLSDTWSHGLDRFAAGPAEGAQWGELTLLERGPLMAAWLHTGHIGRSDLQAEWRLYAGEPFLDLTLSVEWREQFKVLKLVLPLPAALGVRQDGIPGHHLEREPDGKERPVRDFTCLTLAGDAVLGVVCPEVYALDATPDRVRFTLLRSPLMAQHEPHLPQGPRAVLSDRGWHRFRFRFAPGPHVTPAWLDQQALMLQRPLVTADLTKGMPSK